MIEDFQVAEFHKSVTVINDFFTRPDEVLERALSQQYANDGMYPGERSPVQTHGSTLAAIFERYAGVPIVRLESVFQIQTAAHEKESFIHCDMCDWAAVLYLNKGHDGEPGTRFYRHRASGLDRLGRGIVVEGPPPFRDRFDPDKWDVTLTVPMQFNRLVLYNAKLFHRNASAWGADVHDARLVQSFFVSTTPDDT